MDKVTECLDALIEEMRESRAYQNYLWMEEELEKDPDLKSRVDDYRIRNYRLQQSENVDLYDAVDSLERDSYALRKSEKANAYLEAELEVCKMVQKVQDCMLNTTNVHINRQIFICFFFGYQLFVIVGIHITEEVPGRTGPLGHGIGLSLCRSATARAGGVYPGVDRRKRGLTGTGRLIALNLRKF